MEGRGEEGLNEQRRQRGRRLGTPAREEEVGGRAARAGRRKGATRGRAVGREREWEGGNWRPPWQTKLRGRNSRHRCKCQNKREHGVNAEKKRCAAAASV